MKYKNIIWILGLVLCVSCSANKNAKVSPQLRTSYELQFYFDSEKILPTFDGALKDSLDYLQKNPEAVIIIEGHTDKTGNETYNFDLGDRRARAIKAYFVKNEIDPQRIIIVTYGETRPAYQALKLNRRVVFRDISPIQNERKAK